MATFNYTKAQWDKERPKLLPSTGLGKALQEYEVAIKRLFELNFLTGLPAQLRGELPKARTALAKVEEVRRAAIKSCGKLYPETKKLLDSADSAKQEKMIVDALVTQLRPAVEEWRKRIDPKLVSVNNRTKTATKDKADLDALNGEPDDRMVKFFGELHRSYLSKDNPATTTAKAALGEVGYYVATNTAFRATVKPLEQELVALGKRAALLEKLGTDLSGMVLDLRAEIPGRARELGVDLPD